MDVEQKKRLFDLAQEILHRVEVAKCGTHNSQYWDDAEENMGAPDDLSYEDWIDEAETNLLKYIESL